jgi:hypothetical protein
MSELKDVPLPGQGDRLSKCRRLTAPIRPAFGVWPAWARAYRASADLLVDSERGGEEADAQIYTVVYLYRHFLELELKDWLTMPLPDIVQQRLDKLNTAGKLAVGAVGTYVIYRIIRFVPSLFPPLSWTSPPNVALP